MTITLITGANKGLGYETARRLIGLGHTVLAGARDPQRGAAAADELGAAFILIDPTDDASVDAAAARVRSEYGHVDVLINNAGTAAPRLGAEELSAEASMEGFAVNVFGAIRVMHAFLPLLRAAGHPRIVNVSSGVGSFARILEPGTVENAVTLPVYPATKAALAGHAGRRPTPPAIGDLGSTARVGETAPGGGGSEEFPALPRSVPTTPRRHLEARAAPLTIILDELQWLKYAQPALDSIIQRRWDRWDREALPVTLVLAGSALTLMEQLLERGAPLFGRATARPRLGPLDYRDAAGFAADKTPEALLRRWAVLGGTPQYQVWAGDGPLEDIITSRILAKDSALYDEPRHLLREGEGIRDHQSALGGHAAAARLVIFGREQFTPALRERSAAEGIHLVSAAGLFQAE